VLQSARDTLLLAPPGNPAPQPIDVTEKKYRNRNRNRTGDEKETAPAKSL